METVNKLFEGEQGKKIKKALLIVAGALIAVILWKKFGKKRKF